MKRDSLNDDFQHLRSPRTVDSRRPVHRAGNRLWTKGPFPVDYLWQSLWKSSTAAVRTQPELLKPCAPGVDERNFDILSAPETTVVPSQVSLTTSQRRITSAQTVTVECLRW